jgi:hypothetical protein
MAEWGFRGLIQALREVKRPEAQGKGRQEWGKGKGQSKGGPWRNCYPSARLDPWQGGKGRGKGRWEDDEEEWAMEEALYGLFHGMIQEEVQKGVAEALAANTPIRTQTLPTQATQAPYCGRCNQPCGHCNTPTTPERSTSSSTQAPPTPPLDKDLGKLPKAFGPRE